MKKCVVCGIVNVPLSLCGGCMTTVYCGSKCQNHDWKHGEHSLICGKRGRNERKIDEDEWKQIANKGIDIIPLDRGNPIGITGTLIGKEEIMTFYQLLQDVGDEEYEDGDFKSIPIELNYSRDIIQLFVDIVQARVYARDSGLSDDEIDTATKEVLRLNGALRPPMVSATLTQLLDYLDYTPVIYYIADDLAEYIRNPDLDTSGFLAAIPQNENEILHKDLPFDFQPFYRFFSGFSDDGNPLIGAQCVF